jgi:hypothetical protein
LPNEYGQGAYSGKEKEGVGMHCSDKRFFVGIKISAALQRELDKCPHDAEHYFKEKRPESLELLVLGGDRFMGRFLPDGFPVADLENVSRNVRSIMNLITQGHRIAEDSVRIYAEP